MCKEETTLKCDKRINLNGAAFIFVCSTCYCLLRTYNDQILIIFRLVLRCPSSLFCMLGKVDKENFEREQCIANCVAFPDLEYDNQLTLLEFIY